jgi:allophanate hydrolase
MSGMPLNKELLDYRGRFERIARTAPEYRLYALAGGPPQRPGMLRRADGGASIELEIWSLPVWKFAEFVSRIPAPLGIGTVTLEDGSPVQGFLCENYATKDAKDITAFGGWRAYLKSHP